jgi:putative copper export protein
LVAAEILIFGTAMFALALAPDPDSQPYRVVRMLTPMWRVLALQAIFASPLALLVDTANMAGVPLSAALSFVPEVVRQTHLGRVWCWSAPLTVILAIAVWTPIHLSVRAAVLAVLSGALLLLASLSGHAIDRGTAAVAINFIHQIAAALWLGAVCGLWLGGVPGRLGDGWVRQTAPLVSKLAGWAVSALILSGVYLAYDALGADPRRLLYAAYGRTLLVKIGAASLVIMIGAYNRSRLLPAIDESCSETALLRNVGYESGLLLAVLGIAALLANTPPAH